jgi:hypothetical protein
MKTMLDARIVDASTHGASRSAHGAALGAEQMHAASAGGEGSDVIAGRNPTVRHGALDFVQAA